MRVLSITINIMAAASSGRVIEAEVGVEEGPRGKVAVVDVDREGRTVDITNDDQTPLEGTKEHMDVVEVRVWARIACRSEGVNVTL